MEISYFSITQILREINIWGFRSAESAISAHLEALNLNLYEFLHFLEAEINQKKIYRPQILQKWHL